MHACKERVGIETVLQYVSSSKCTSLSAAQSLIDLRHLEQSKVWWCPTLHDIGVRVRSCHAFLHAPQISAPRQRTN